MNVVTHPITLPAWQALLLLLPLVAGISGALAITPSRSVRGAWRIAQGTLGLALLASLVALAGVALQGPAHGAGLRADAPGAIALALIAFIGWVIARYARQYLDGEAGVQRHARWLLATLTGAMVVVSTNHLAVLALAWAGTSFALHHLLTFYAHRPAARVAAHKKFILGRIADVAMLSACALLWHAHGTLQINQLAGAAGTGPGTATQVALLLVAAAAVLKCAQLPFHGWLIQVMEAPTPVSALLHAGVVNLGGFVLLRLAPLVDQVLAAQLLLVVVGSATAVVAALVMTTRISIKVALAWSTCAQMGFMLMQCGLGLWDLALLHLVAHSLYKAHAFLAAGGTVRQTLVGQLAVRSSPPSLRRELLAALLALGATAAAAQAWGLDAAATPALWLAGAIVALAFAPLLAGAAAGRGALALLALVGVYFGLHVAASQWVVAPRAAELGPLWLWPAACFAALFLLQAVLRLAPQGRLARRLYPWFYGGLFLDERVSRWLFRRWPLPPLAARPADVPAVSSQEGLA